MATTVIGSTFMDVKGFAFGEYDPDGTNIGKVMYTPGGVCRNVCEDFANMHEPVSFVSMTDDSVMGQFMLSELKRVGVDVSNVIVCEGGMGIWLAVMNKSGKLKGSISQQPDFSQMQKLIEEKGEEIIAKADSIVLELDMNAYIAEQILDLTQKLNKPVYAIVANMDVILSRPDLLSKVTCFICNNFEARRLLNEAVDEMTPEEVLERIPAFAKKAGVKSMIITLGSNGSVYYDTVSGRRGHQRSLPTVVKDSTGAGDAFFAGVVMAFSHGLSIEKAVEAGTRLASATLARSYSACPYIEDLF